MDRRVRVGAGFITVNSTCSPSSLRKYITAKVILQYPAECIPCDDFVLHVDGKRRPSGHGQQYSLPCPTCKYCKRNP